MTVLRRMTDINRKERLQRVLGYANEPGADILSIAKGYDLPTRISGESAESGRARGRKPVSEADTRGAQGLKKLADGYH